MSLDLPSLWSHINFTELSQLTPAGAAEMLARAKKPLHLRATLTAWDIKNVTGQIEAHIHHTRHLSISANYCEATIFEAPIF
jgi:hypothetical protein